MKPNKTGMFSRSRLGRAASNRLIAFTLSCVALPSLLSAQTLLHRYSFVSDASDSVGTADGTIVPPTAGTAVSINNGLTLPGGGGGGFSGYVSLPSGILTDTASITVECWTTQNTANTWATPWDFANSGSQNFGLIPSPGNNGGNMEVAFTPHGNEVDLQSSIKFPTGSEQYVSVTFNNSTLVGNLYTNGTLIATHTFPDASYTPGVIGGAGGTTVNALGNNIYGDPQYQGVIQEFRIWNGVVSPVYLAASTVAGPTVVITNTVPQNLSVSVITTMVGAQTQQATVSGDFVQVSGVSLTSAVSAWTSSKPSVLTVNSNGLITAISGGTATVSATVNGITATSATITVALTVPTISQAPTNVTAFTGQSASFSVQALGGGLTYQWSFGATPIAGATNATLTLTNLAITDSGTYNVLVSNTLGSTNRSAVLTVISPTLLHRYSFVSDVSDSVGTANGTVVAPNGGDPATIANGLTLPGGGGPGFSGYVTLPPGILTNTSSVTIEGWVTQVSGNNWAQIWNFGNSQSQNMGLIPLPNRDNGNFEVAINPNNDELNIVSQIHFPTNSQQYVALVFNSLTLQGSLYANGTLLATRTFPDQTYIPGSIGGASGTTNNVLGQDPYPDPQFQGMINELRIWNGPVSPLYLAVSAAAGPGIVVTNVTPVSLAITTPNSSLLAGQTQQAVVTGNFTEATGVPISGLATNWTSSNPGVLTVNSSGFITAVSTGSATVSATFAGVTGTSPSITVPNSPPVITQQPPASETLLAGATLKVTVGVIGNPPFTYRWFFNAGPTPISTTTTPVLTIPNVQASNAGSYTCLVSNQFGTTLSSALVLSVVAPNTYQQAILSLNPLAYWPLTEASGTIAYDEIGGYNGTYTGSYLLGQPGPTSPIFGPSSTAAQFDGTTAYVDIPGGPFNITNAVTTVGWVNLIGIPVFGGIIGHGDTSYRMSVNNSSQPSASDGNAPGDNDASSPTSILGDWHMVTYTYSGVPAHANNGLLYVDGLLVASNTISVTPTGNNLDVWIGGAPDYQLQRLLPANISHAAIFTQALSPAQVQGLYNGVYVAGVQTIVITRTGSSVTLSWQAGTLLQAPTVLGPFTTNSAAVSPYTVPASSGNQFFKVLVTP